MVLYEYGQWISNKNVQSLSNETLDVQNPTDHSLLGKVPKGCQEDASAALEVAKKAQPAWAAKPAVQRAELLKEMATIIRQNRLELIDILIKEQAKVKGLATVEIDVSADYYDMYAGMARLGYEGEILQSDNAGEHIYVHRAPIGVSVGICPWNFPFFVMARKVAPALLAGCTVVVKSSEETPLTCFRFTQLLEQAMSEGKLKTLKENPGIVSVVTGLGSTIGEALVKHPIPDIISMTGSLKIGQHIMSAASVNMTKVSLELGGKAPVIVMDDCDVDATVQAIVDSRVIYSGQVCNCAERLYVQESIYETFVDKLVACMKDCQVGDPFDEKSNLGGLINQAQFDKVCGMVNRAKEQGAEALCGGDPISAEGYKYPPTILVNVKQDSEIMQHEIFGPVLPVMKFETFDDALALANDCQYGLASSLFTNNYKYIERVRTELLFGETYINRFHFEGIQGFHAGWRKSGIGGADGKHGLLEYLSTKVIYVQR